MIWFRRSMRTLLTLLILLLSAQTVRGQAQDSLRLNPGDRIRLAGPLPDDASWISATVVEVDPHSFTFRLNESPTRTFTREFQTVDTIDVAYRNSRESARGGGVVGGFLGVSLGLLAGAILAPHVSTDTGPAMAAAGLGGGLIGGALGALTAASISPVRWHRYVFQDMAMPANPPPSGAGPR